MSTLNDTTPYPSATSATENGQSATGCTPTTLRQLADIVGEEHVDISDGTRSYHGQAMIPWRRDCRAVVHPGSTAEVSALVKLAEDMGLQLWTFSTGKNWGYGTTQTLSDNAVVVLLDRMNQIIEVNEDLAYAIIEPGVTQQQLHDYLKQKGSRLWIDCTDSTPHGSVLGNALERGVGYTPYGDHFGQLCGMEVVLPCGEVMHTGGAAPLTRSRHTYKWGTGPYVDGIFSQSNYGIVTRAGIWLMPAPEEFNFCAIEVKDHRRFPEFLNDARDLALDRVIGNIHCFNPFLLMSARMTYPFEQRGDRTHLSDQEIAELARQQRISDYTMVCGIYGNREQVRAQRRIVKRKLGHYGRVLFANDRKIEAIRRITHSIRNQQNPWLRAITKKLVSATIYNGPLEALEMVPEVYAYHKGEPGNFIVGAAYFKKRMQRPTTNIDPIRDHCGLVWLAPVIPATSRDFLTVYELAKATYERHGFELAFSVIMHSPRSFLIAMPMFYDKDDPAETNRVAQLYEAMTNALVQAGYQQYRTSSAYMDKILEVAPQYGNLVRQLKTTIDPHNVLAPGRYGL